MARKSLNDDLDRFYDKKQKELWSDDWNDLATDKGVEVYNPQTGEIYPGKYTSTSGTTSSYKSKGYDSYERCFKSHPPLKIGEHTIYGGSCSSPVVTDADTYIGFDRGMTYGARSWPWKKGHEFLFAIQDMGVPAAPEEFKKLVAWTAKQLQAGQKVHCGCIGGHGRTGMFLSALVCEMTGEKDAISYVRKNYCVKAVETASQVQFLTDHFGILPAKGSKAANGVRKSDPWDKPSKGGKGVIKHSVDGLKPELYYPMESSPKRIW